MGSDNDGDDITAGQTNKCQSGTELLCEPPDGNPRNDFVFRVGAGLFLTRGGDAILGDGTAVGVHGKGNSYGVLGDNADTGVYGNGSRFGVQGSSSAGLYGGAGVYGETANAIGVAGFSQNSIAVYGQCGDPVRPTPTAAAGVFYGPVFVIGDLRVYGQKAAAVPHRDGTHRLLYAVESPESWFEDFGEAKLERGRAKVEIDAEFAAVIKSGGYFVFVTPCGDCNGLFVSRRSRAEFEVRELQNGKSNARFCYRIIARRKDIGGERLPRVPSPNDLLKTMKLPWSAPAAPQRRRGRSEPRR